MKKILIIIGLVLTIIGLIFGAEKEIEWTAYLGIPLVIFFGAAGITFITKRIEAVIAGLVLAALWPVLWEFFQTAVSSLP